jgi:Zn-finger nucleic acid-binding protein
MTERQAVEIDYCPACRGVWLDRAELDKIIDRSVGAAPAEQLKQPIVEGYREEPRRDDRYRSDDDDRDRKRKRRGGWLEDLLDFD